VNDPEPPLNVRSTASTQGTVVGQLKNRTFVTVIDDQQGWFQITTPIKGWIAKARTESGCNQKVERITFGVGGQSVTIRDRFIGTGTHRYLLQANQGQTLTLRRQQGPFPTLRSPDGSVLVIGAEAENRPSWTGQLPKTGNYQVELDSNYRGYKYNFSVEIQ